MHRRAVLVAAALPIATCVPAAPTSFVEVPPEVAQALPGAVLQGQGQLRFFGLRIYDARLWSAAQPVGADWAAVPFALELRYARPLSGQKIAERSLKEMQRQREIAPADEARWLQLLARLVPDVDEGDRITGVNQPGRGARLYVNGRFRGLAPDPAFARLFFGIWLAPQTSEPDLRLSLLGRGAS